MTAEQRRGEQGPCSEPRHARQWGTYTPQTLLNLSCTPSCHVLSHIVSKVYLYSTIMGLPQPLSNPAHGTKPTERRTSPTMLLNSFRGPETQEPVLLFASFYRPKTQEPMGILAFVYGLETQDHCPVIDTPRARWPTAQQAAKNKLPKTDLNCSSSRGTRSSRVV